MFGRGCSRTCCYVMVSSNKCKLAMRLSVLIVKCNQVKLKVDECDRARVVQLKDRDNKEGWRMRSDIYRSAGRNESSLTIVCTSVRMFADVRSEGKTSGEHSRSLAYFGLRCSVWMTSANAVMLR